MKHYINLTNPSASFCKVTVSNFPDGQVGVELDLDCLHENRIVQINSRFSNYKDLFTILATNQILQDAGYKVELVCPYILSARSDRKFKHNQSFDLKLIAQILNSAKFQKVYVLDGHSDVLTALIENSINISPLTWIDKCKFDWKDKILVSPDAGAFKKIFSIADKLQCELLSGSKVRIPNGAPQVVIHGDVSGRDCVIVDDICDGGRTFVELGKLLKEMGAKSVTLFVTHGIFSKGIQLENVDAVYTTNSYQPFDSTMQTDYFHFVNIF